MRTSLLCLFFAGGCATERSLPDAQGCETCATPVVTEASDDDDDDSDDGSDDDGPGADGVVDEDDPTDGCTGCDDTDAPTASVPGEVLDLTNWYLTLPFGEELDPTLILQPKLESYSQDPHFRVGEDGGVVVFNANAGGVTTSGSHFPRSELREMTSGGTEKAAWSTTDGAHTMTIVEAITHLPEVVPHVVAGQIHDAEEYVLLVRLDGDRLWVKSGGEDVGALDEDYVLGEEFTLRLTAANGWIDVYYNDLDTPAVRVPYETTGCYFKAGSYLQTNTEYGDAPDAYAEVEIRELVVTHE